MLDEVAEKVKAARVRFALPSYDGRVCVQYLNSMAGTMKLFHAYGIQWSVSIVQGDCYVARARNELAAAFLRSDSTHLFFIDADMGWDPDAVIKLLARDKELILGAYHLKNDKTPKKYVIEPIHPAVQENGIFRVLSGPTGFMCIHRSVFEKMAEQYPDLEYVSEKGHREAAFFHCSLRKLGGATVNSWYGEDIDFCHKWAAMGGEIWCDPNITLDHVGQKVWTCNLTDDLAAEASEIAKEIHE